MLSHRPFTLKPEPLVQMYRRLVIRIDLKLQSREVEPVIRKVYPGLHQRRPDALSLPLDMHRYPNCSDVSPARSIRKSMQPQHPYHMVTDHRHKVVCSITRFCKPLPPLLARWIWQLKRSCNHLRAAKHLEQSRTVIRLSTAYL